MLKEIVDKYPNRGFDEIAFLSNSTKEEVIDYWNQQKLGLKHVPRTLVSLTKITGADYVTNDMIVVYITKEARLVIPEGFRTDLGSVPRVLRWFVDKDDPRFLVAFILHDVLYRTQDASRSIADAILHLTAKRIGAPWYLNHLVYLALRLGGWVAWNRNSKDKKGMAYAMEQVQKASHAYNDSHPLTKIKVKDIL